MVHVGSPIQANSQAIVSEHRKAIPIATNKASGLSARINITKAEQAFIKGDKNTLDGWFLLWEDMNRLGARYSTYAKAYRENPKRKTAHSESTVSQYLGAIQRAVTKFGSLRKAQDAYYAWVTANYYGKGEISTFLKWAPAGQRAKNEDKAVSPVGTKTWTRAEYVKAMTADLVELGFTKNAAKAQAERFARKHFVTK